MKKPIPEMTHTPYGEDYLFPGWLSCVRASISMPDFVKQFKDDTGIDILSVIHSRGLTKMIDEATGYDKVAITKWADWVTLNLWGVE